MILFFARITTCVFSTDCDEQFEKLAIVLERIGPASRFRTEDNSLFKRIARAIRRNDSIFLTAI